MCVCARVYQGGVLKMGAPQVTVAFNSLHRQSYRRGQGLPLLR